MKESAGRVLRKLILMLTAGMLYGLFYIKTGIGIPCVFHKISGLYCPGCGITHMCIFLMQGDIPRAMESNHMLFVLSPFLVYFFADYILRYIRTGKRGMGYWQTAALYCMSAMLLIYCIVRNLLALQL